MLSSYYVNVKASNMDTLSTSSIDVSKIFQYFICLQIFTECVNNQYFFSGLNITVIYWSCEQHYQMN